jgi:hypothetical protein
MWSKQDASPKPVVWIKSIDAIPAKLDRQAVPSV